MTAAALLLLASPLIVWAIRKLRSS
jgi:hypothetical protein